MFFLGIESFITLFYKKILARFDTIGNTLLCFYPKMNQSSGRRINWMQIKILLLSLLRNKF